MSIRLKLMLISLTMLVLPWTGCQYMSRMEDFLRQNQEKTLTIWARTVSTLLSHSEDRLYPYQDLRESNGNDIYVFPQVLPLEVDGYGDDWGDLLLSSQRLDEKNALYNSTTNPTIQLKWVAAADTEHVYFFINVEDDKVIYRDPQGYATDGDYIEVAMMLPSDDFARVMIAPSKAGEVDVDISGLEDAAVAKHLKSNITAFWRSVSSGYTVEIKVAREVLGPRFGFVAGDVDSQELRRLRTTIGTGEPASPYTIGALVLPVAAVTNVAKQMGLEARVTVIDMQRRVRGREGQIYYANEKGDDESWPYAVIRFLYQVWLRPSYELRESIGRYDRSTKLDFVGTALSSEEPTVRWRRTANERVVSLAVTYPIRDSVGNIEGIVLVERATQAVQSTTNAAMVHLVNSTAVALLIAGGGLLAFATVLSFRLRRLRNAADTAMKSDGSLADFPKARSRDELGDLSRSFAHLLENLRDYTDYLKSLASKLSHELRTPLAVVKSSVENLQTRDLDEDAKVYADRAYDGASRLGSILNAMSAATRIEQSIQHAEPEIFSLNAVAKSCFSAYQDLHASRNVVIEVIDEPCQVLGLPELIAQALDKLVDNAVDFTPEGGRIHLSLSAHKKYCALKVSNEGPLLPEKMQGRLFDSLVSLREQGADSSHLGLGLYIVRLITEFHQGRVQAYNMEGGEGVVFELRLPLAEV